MDCNKKLTIYDNNSQCGDCGKPITKDSYNMICEGWHQRKNGTNVFGHKVIWTCPKCARYKESLDVGQADRFKIYHSFEYCKQALEFAELIDGQVYTKVDTATPMGFQYSRGCRFVNRTGYYIVVKYWTKGSDNLISPTVGCKCTMCR